jgi:hypothetical protein
MANKRKILNIQDATLWYLVGLITADGCLSLDGRHVDITAKDYCFLQGLKEKVGFKNKIGIKNQGKFNEAYHIQLSNKSLYEFLVSIGLTPTKSLIQRDIDVPDRYFIDFCRGVIDGDGSIRKWLHPSNKAEQWSLRIYSSAFVFIKWLQKEIQRLLLAKGRIHRSKQKSKANIYVLKYGKIAAKNILQSCYYQKALVMERKAGLAKECCLSGSGWKNYKAAVLN